jgi:hypothetical protein
MIFRGKGTHIYIQDIDLLMSVNDDGRIIECLTSLCKFDTISKRANLAD